MDPATAALGLDPCWLDFSDDGKTGFVALGGANAVAVMDLTSNTVCGLGGGWGLGA